MLLILPIVSQKSFASDSNSVIETIPVECEGNYYDLSYQVSNAVVSIIPFDSNVNLSMSIQNSTNGIITIYIPRQFLDARIEYNNDSFFVIANDREISFSDTSNSTYRILTIPIPNETTQLEIIAVGTPESMSQTYKRCTVVPEFGSLALMIISISIIGVILIQKRFRF